MSDLTNIREFVNINMTQQEVQEALTLELHR